MDAVVMCGGRGTRLESEVEKPLFEIAGLPMVQQVLDALSKSSIDGIYAAVSPHTPETKAFLDGRYELIETAGEGYVSDLSTALDEVGFPVLTVAADLPLLDAEIIERVCKYSFQAEGSVTVCVPAALKRQLGASIDSERDGLVPTGLNVVDAAETEQVYTSYDARLAVNVNRQSDAELAELLHPQTAMDRPSGRQNSDKHRQKEEQTDGS